MYDEKCYELARWFLIDEPADLDTPEKSKELAQAIQDAIEVFIAYEKS